MKKKFSHKRYVREHRIVIYADPMIRAHLKELAKAKQMSISAVANEIFEEYFED